MEQQAAYDVAFGAANQDSVSVDEVITGEAVALDVRPTSFILRAAGSILDMLVSFATLMLCLLVIMPMAGGLDPAGLATLTLSLVVVCLVVLPIAIELLTHGRSVGRLAVGARIVRLDGGAIKFRHAFIRALVGVIEIYMSLGGFAAIAGLLTPRTQRLGDLLAGTYSQYERVPAARFAPLWMPPELQSWARLADVGPLPDALGRRISQFLDQASGMTPPSRIALASALANEAAQYIYPLPQCHPEALLVAVTVLRREREATALAAGAATLNRLAPILRGPADATTMPPNQPG